MLKISRKSAEAALALGLICAIFLSVSRFNVACDDLRSNILRLHIIANSDSTKDQSLKLEIRDEILQKTDRLFLNVSDLENAKKQVSENLPVFEEIANTVIKRRGFDYTASVSLGDAYFDTRVYDEFTLPAGYYPSLIIKLGKAEGKNWWCVVFPAVCIPAASNAELSDTVDENSAQVAYSPQRYILRFKAVEIYEKIKKSINK